MEKQDIPNWMVGLGKGSLIGFDALGTFYSIGTDKYTTLGGMALEEEYDGSLEFKIGKWTGATIGIGINLAALGIPQFATLMYDLYLANKV